MYHAYPSTATHSGRESAAVLSFSNRRPTMSHVCGIARSVVFGRMFMPRIEPPSSGPTHL